MMSMKGTRAIQVVILAARQHEADSGAGETEVSLVNIPREIVHGIASEMDSQGP